MSANQVANAAPDDATPVDAPPPTLRIVGFAVLALGIGVGIARWFEAGARAELAAYVQVRTSYVTADRHCRVVNLQQAVGQRIAVGDPLITFTDTDLERQIAAARVHVEALNKELCQAQATAKLELAQNEQALDDRICQVQLQVADYRQSRQESEMRRSLLADLLASHQSAMWDSGQTLVKSLLFQPPWPNGERIQTVLQMETYATQADLLAANIEICESRLASLRDYKSGLFTQIEESCGVGVIEYRLQQAQQELAQLEEQQAQLTIPSPAQGQVGVYRSRPGSVLQPGDPIVELHDDSQRYLIAGVPSTRIHEFKVGRTVSLSFPGDERRQGRVARIAPQANARDASDPSGDPLVDVEIEQLGRLWPSVPVGTRIATLLDR